MKTTDDCRQWLLLDVPAAPGAVEALKERYARYLAYNLFEGTAFQGLGEVAPRLLQLAGDCPLSRLSQANPSLWPGLFLHSRAPVRALLAHLRQILVVGFDDQHRGLLSYYNPQTASYFFDSSDPHELSGWLGPIHCLYWHGGTWADKAIGSIGWQQLFNPGLEVPALATPPVLSSRQQRRLQTCLLERHAYQWSRCSGHEYDRTWCHVQEGIAQGFREYGLLDGWLHLRAEYPAAAIPAGLRGDSPVERLENLRRVWSGSSD
ncbi:DUF4123 domain-containing protein [Pseudomonas sp. MWU13-2100]|uniref:DUF4123 domain-containing protein n=1 Tax=Pseudomonas sp. MWU13-2100 TaxID=2935075 RepID=UPI00200C30DA|nr:DUF4123 domain-containing protein [Pseudomonas sp. MWU13-2100]